MKDAQRIAVVDDDIGTRETVADYLKMHGFDVVGLSGGQALRAELAGRKLSPFLDYVQKEIGGRVKEAGGLSIISV